MGARSFVLNYSIHGRDSRITIGAFPTWSTAQAREEARALRRRIDVGEDPLADRRAAREAPTVADLAARYLEEHAARKKPRGLSEDTALIRQHVLPRLGRLRVADVNRQDIAAFHRAISAKTPVRANRTLSLVSKMFGLSVQWELRPDNPCRGVSHNREFSRERYLSPDELSRLMAALAADKRQDRANMIRLLLLTGARRGEVVHATWDEFDLNTGVWTKPAGRTKQQKLHRIPLSGPARLILADMREAADGPLLFPARRRDGMQADLVGFWRAICRTAGIEGVRMHDLRHAFASFLVSGGLSLAIIGSLLGHSQPSTTARYSHLMDDPLRAATEKVGEIIENAAPARRAL